MVDFKIPDEEVRALMSTRLLDALSAETRERLIADALRHLTTTPRSHYGGNKSPVQGAFEEALHRMASGVADEVLAESGVADKLKEQFRELLVAMPDFHEDHQLQAKMLQVVLDRAKEIRASSRYD